MTALPNTTLRRLMKLPQIPTVWEGDRRSLEGIDDLEVPDKQGQFIIWVDGTEGMVRSMEIVSSETGPEVIVRALIKGMEHPQAPGRPARPQKLVVRDREIQFFLRGVLQDLEITIDYVPELPIIDELFARLAEFRPPRSPKLPPQYADLLIERAYELWADAPWELVADHQVIAIELNKWDLETIYISILGMLELDYGIIFYRTLDSLKRFRAAALAQSSMEDAEQAFLGQDCLFLTFSAKDEEEGDEDEDVVDLVDLSLAEITPQFGSIHPFEGMRPTLSEEEAIALAVALEALHKFFKDNHRKLNNNFPRLKKTYNITPPPDSKHPELIPKPVAVQILSLPDVATELLAMGDQEEDDEDELPAFTAPLRDDLIPKQSFCSLGMIPWEALELIKNHIKHHQTNPKLAAKGEGLPVLILQTTRPKAKTIVERITAAGGLEGIAFNLGEDPFHDTSFDLGILKMYNKEMYVFQEFSAEDPVHIKARKKWDQRNKTTQGVCGLIIAAGLTGNARGNPSPRDMVALFEVRHIETEELGFGTLELLPKDRWELDW